MQQLETENKHLLDVNADLLKEISFMDNKNLKLQQEIEQLQKEVKNLKNQLALEINQKNNIFKELCERGKL